MKAVLPAILIFWTSAALANDLDWLTSKQEVSGISQMAAGFAAAGRCDRLVNTAVVAKWLAASFGGRSFTPDEMAKTINVVIGVQAMQGALAGPATPKYCADVRKAFGPGGTTIPGFFD